MIKNLLTTAAMALLTLSASAETYDLSVQAGWGASAALPGTTLVANSGWGEFVLATNVSVTDYKGCRIEYSDATSGWQFKILIGTADKYPAEISSDNTSQTVSFSSYDETLSKIEIQAKAADEKITIKSFVLIKNDDSEEAIEIAPGGGWGITVGGLTSTPCAMFFTEQYGGVELYKADGSKCTWSPTSKAEQVYTVTLEEGAPFELLIEADDVDGKGAIYSYPNLVAGETTFTLTIPADNAKEISSVWLKSAVKPSSASVKIKSITLTETKEGQTAITDIEAADENAPVEYFNLQGVRVENPSNGLYIRRQGSKVTKVII